MKNRLGNRLLSIAGTTTVGIVLLFSLFVTPAAACETAEECRQAYDAVDFPSSADFQRLENPTYMDLQKLGNPTIADFRKLSDGEQRQYIVHSSFAPRDKSIAEEYFSETANINRDKSVFGKYMDTEGVSITLRGNVQSFTPEGLLTGKTAQGKEWSINILRWSDDFQFEVDREHNLVLRNVQEPGQEPGEQFVITGRVEQALDRTMYIPQGSINDHDVVDAQHIQFGEEFISMNVAQFDGLAFEERAAVKFWHDETLDIVDGTPVQALEQNRIIYIKGNVVADKSNYEHLKGELRIRPADSASVQYISMMNDDNEDIIVRFQAEPLVSGEALPPWQREGNHVTFAPRTVEIDGANINSKLTGSYLKTLSRGAVTDPRAAFEMNVQAGKVVIRYDHDKKTLLLTTQGVVSYQSGPQQIRLGNEKSLRFYSRSLSSIAGIPIIATHFDSDGRHRGTIRTGDFNSYNSPDRSVLLSMQSNAEALSIMRTITLGTPEEITALNQRVNEITQKWDNGIEPEEQEIQFVTGVYKSLMAGSRVLHGSTAATTLYHYLEATGEPIDYDADLFLRRPEVRYAMEEMENQLINRLDQGENDVTLTSAVVKDKHDTVSEQVALEEVSTTSFGTIEDGVIWTPDKDLRYSFGKFHLQAAARREGDDVLIEWRVDDVYDYEPNSIKSIKIPTGQVASALNTIFGEESPKIQQAGFVPSRAEETKKKFVPDVLPLVVPDRLAAYLAISGHAKEFDMRSRWTMRCHEGKCVMEN